MDKENNKIKSNLVKKDNDSLIKITNALDISKKIVSESLSRVSTLYQSNIIGEQEWMLENLDVPHFRNGDLIHEARTNEEWQQAIDEKQPAWCYYENKKQYGKLYNVYTIQDEREVAPSGWRVPSSKDWDSLIKHFGGKEKASNLIQSSGFTPNFSGERYFDFLGDRNFHFRGLNLNACYLSSSLSTSKTGIVHFGLYKKTFDDNVFNIDTCVLGFERGYAIKCLKL